MEAEPPSLNDVLIDGGLLGFLLFSQGTGGLPGGGADPFGAL